MLYKEDIYRWMRVTEVLGKFQPNINYMNIQQELSASMRSILVDWLIDIHWRFRLTSETLFIAINLIDRFLMRIQVARSRFQLVGLTSLIIASKYQEIDIPSVQDLVHLTDNAYNVDDFVQMESLILQVLEFNFTFPTSLSFLETFIQEIQTKDLPTQYFTTFLLEMSLIELNMQRFSPSVLALAALYVAMRTM